MCCLSWPTFILTLRLLFIHATRWIYPESRREDNHILNQRHLVLLVSFVDYHHDGN